MRQRQQKNLHPLQKTAADCLSDSKVLLLMMSQVVVKMHIAKIFLPGSSFTRHKTFESISQPCEPFQIIIIIFLRVVQDSEMKQILCHTR